MANHMARTEPRHTFVLVFIITLFLPATAPVELTFRTILVCRISIAF